MMTTPFVLKPEIAQRIGTFASDLKNLYGDNIHSFYVIGSCLTSDYREKNSDINSLVVLHEVSLNHIEVLWNLGKRHHKKGIAAPLCMTPQYITESIDVFPIEFHDFKLIHLCIIGEDILTTLEINKEHLRLQCEREIKTRLINLRQSYLSSLGDEKQIISTLINSINFTAPLFRAILQLLNLPTPINKADVFRGMQEYIDYKGDLFNKMLLLKEGKVKLSNQDLKQLFNDFYHCIERLGTILNTL